MILQTILPLFFVTFSVLSDGPIFNNNEDSVATDNVYFSVNFDYDLYSVNFDYDSEFARVTFSGFTIQLYTYNVDLQSDGYNELAFFEDLIFELPFYSTNITNYYITFTVDDWTISEDNVNIDWIVDIWYSDSGESMQHSHYYTESDAYFASDYINIDEFLFYYDIGFEIEFYNLSEYYQSLNAIYGDSYENGYEAGSEAGYIMGYEQGFDAGSGQHNGVLEFFRSIFNTIDEVGNVEILPYIKIWYIIGIPIILAIVRFALGWFR